MEGLGVTQDMKSNFWLMAKCPKSSRIGPKLVTAEGEILSCSHAGNWLEMGFELPKWGIHPCAERSFAPGNLRCFRDEGEAEKLLVLPSSSVGRVGIKHSQRHSENW